MMYETTLTEFRKHTKRYFDKIEQGEMVRIYRNGRPIGDLVPVSADRRQLEAAKRAGLYVDDLSSAAR